MGRGSGRGASAAKSERGRGRPPRARAAVAPKSTPSKKLKVSSGSSSLPEASCALQLSKAESEEFLPGVVSGGAGEVPTSSPRRRLDRRDTDERVERLKRDKFRAVGIDDRIYAGAVDENGVGLHQYLQEQVRLHRKLKKNFSTRFWKDIWARFPLASGSLNSLRGSDDDDIPRAEVLDKLELLTHDNPSARTSDALERFLEMVTVPLNRCELVGIIKCAQPSPVITRALYIRTQAALLCYFARTFGLLQIQTGRYFNASMTLIKRWVTFETLQSNTIQLI